MCHGDITAQTAGCQLERLVGRADFIRSFLVGCLWRLSALRIGCQCTVGEDPKAGETQWRVIFGAVLCQGGVAEVVGARIAGGFPTRAQGGACMAENGCKAGLLRRLARSIRAGRERTAGGRCCTSCRRRTWDRRWGRSLVWSGIHPCRRCRASRDRAGRGARGRW